MKNRTLTALIVRLAGFAFFIKIFDFFGEYFMSIYMVAQIAIVDETSSMVDSFDKLYITGAVMAFSNLALSIILIFNAEWIAKKIIKKDSEIKIELTQEKIMRIIIFSIGVFYCASALYQLPLKIERLFTLIKKDIVVDNRLLIVQLISYVIRISIGVLFISKSEQLTKFSLKR